MHLLLDAEKPVSAPQARQAHQGIAAGASNRSVAKVLGVDEITVRRDTAANAAPEQEKPSKTNAAESTSAANAAPTILSGAAAAQAVQSKEKKEERKQAKVEAAVQWGRTGVCW